MTIQFHENTVLHGSPGVVTTTISLVAREEFAKRHSELSKTAQSFGDFLKNRSEASLKIHNPYTQKDQEIPYDTLVRSFKGTDFANSILSYTFEFKSDDPVNHPLYLTDIVDELREEGWPEERIQELLERAKGGPKPE